MSDTAGLWDAVVWDLDGTLADTLRDLADATNAVLTEAGFDPHGRDAYRHMVGNGARRLIERAAGSAPPETVARLLAAFVRRYDADCLRHTAPYPGIPDVLAALRAAGVPMLVVTNKPEAQARRIASSLFGEGAFAAVFGGREGRRPKPDTATTSEALALVGARPERALFVGDSDVDMMTARAAGMAAGGAAWGFRGAAELRRAGADFVWDSPAAMLAAVEERATGR